MPPSFWASSISSGQAFTRLRGPQPPFFLQSSVLFTLDAVSLFTNIPTGKGRRHAVRSHFGSSTRRLERVRRAAGVG
eukprot:1496560-Lingulodinium_polyedra.AAC.1